MMNSKNVYSYKSILLFFLLNFCSCITWGQIGLPGHVSSRICEGFTAEVHTLTCSPDDGNPNGSVAIQVSGGTPFAPPADPYATFDGNHVGNGLYEDDGLAPGTYTYTYWDSNRCEAEVTFTIGGDECCDFTAEVQNSACSPDEGNPNGNVTIQVTGGTPFPPPADPYATFDGNYVGNGLYEDDGLDPGTYTYTYWDSNGCETEVTFTISGDPCCDFKAEVYGTIPCSQVGNPNANISIKVSGGTRFSPPSDPYQTVNGNHVGNGIYEESDLGPGTYTYVYRDRNGCEAEVTFTIFEGPDATSSVAGCSQVGNPNGNVSIQVVGGTPFPPPADPYETYDGNYVGNGVYEDDGLAPGTYTYTYWDSNGCSDDVTFTIPEPLTAEATSSFGCGEIQVELSGGTPPYTSNYNGQQNNSGIFVFTFAPDSYVLSFTDANGCGVTVALEEPNIALCDDFTFSVDENAASGGFWNSNVFVSGVHAKIGVHLYALNVHDVLRVEINDVEILYLEAGAARCDQQNNCNGDNQSNCAEFFVNCCDKVTFQVEGATCGGRGTIWDLDVTCLRTWGECFDKPIDTRSDSGVILSMEDFVSNTQASIDRTRVEGTDSESVSIFPNPTSGLFHINKSKHQYELQTVKIMDVAGNIVKVENIQGLENPQVDSSTLPVGLYLLEITDSEGNVFVQKLVKN